jgi:hypothetical protein
MVLGRARLLLKPSTRRLAAARQLLLLPPRNIPLIKKGGAASFFFAFTFAEASMNFHKTHRKLDQPALFGRYLDLLLLGGLSVFAFILIEFAQLSNAEMIALAGAMLFLSNFVNNPHFIHSYQLFYAIKKSLADPSTPALFRRRWWFAAVGVPVLVAILIGFSIWRMYLGESFFIALCINLLGALVGWHYVKQGFGMAMLDSKVKSQYWSDQARTALLWNAYSCWALAWLLVNGYNNAGANYWGFFGLAFSVPSYFILLACCVVCVTTSWMVVEVFRDWKEKIKKGLKLGGLPINGFIVYLISIYLWTVFSWINSAFLLVVPFFHSLQYLVVVYRHMLNDPHEDSKRRRMKMLRFIGGGLFFGAAGFWLVPSVVDYMATGRIPIYSQGAFLGMASAWLFINVHHYFIDNVLWRKDSRKVNLQLLSHLERR